MDQSPDGVFAIAQAVVVVISEEMGANTVTIVMANRATLWVRLFGIDVPESRQGEHCLAQPYGPEAMAYLQGLVQGQRVRVEIYGVDGHHRLLGTLFIEERNVNLVMVEVGLAEMYRDPGLRDPYRAQYEAAEASARAGKRGMWILGDQYESPHDYRRRIGLSQ
jgi:endonuclease YncB( thermonuclease family)